MASMGAATKSQAHFKRWITGLSALMVLILCVVAGGLVFTLLAGLGGVVCLWEYFRMVCPAATRTISRPVLMTAYATHVGLIIAAHAARPAMFPVVLGLNVVLCGFLSLWRFPSDRGILEVVAKEIQGVCYISLAIAMLILVRSTPDGMIWIFFVCAVIFAGDTAALYIGSLWGRHKLSPSISPGKTIEGALAGLAANLLVGVVSRVLLLVDLGWSGSLLFCAAVGIAGQVGDLFESELKRASNIKDSGGLLPGHGGVLDRIDALLFAAPVAFCFRMYILSS
jgi:phosphatidate cytidylyltransferase